MFRPWEERAWMLIFSSSREWYECYLLSRLAGWHWHVVIVTCLMLARRISHHWFRYLSIKDICYFSLYLHTCFSLPLFLGSYMKAATGSVPKLLPCILHFISIQVFQYNPSTWFSATRVNLCGKHYDGKLDFESQQHIWEGPHWERKATLWGKPL